MRFGFGDLNEAGVKGFEERFEGKDERLKDLRYYLGKKFVSGMMKAI